MLIFQPPDTCCPLLLLRKQKHQGLNKALGATLCTPTAWKKNWSEGDISMPGAYRVVRGELSTSDLFSPRASVSRDNGIKNWFHQPGRGGGRPSFSSRWLTASGSQGVNNFQCKGAITVFNDPNSKMIKMRKIFRPFKVVVVHHLKDWRP